MADHDPDTLPTSVDPSGPCPVCGRISNFDMGSQLTLDSTLVFGTGNQASDVEFVKVTQLTCMGCRESSIVIERRDDTSAAFTPVLWWPTPGATNLDASVPNAVVKAYDEGVRCLSIQAPNAGVTMLRNALAQIVQDKGSEDAKKKKTLNDAIDQMVSDRTLWETFGTWAHRVRTMGNAGAHQETYSDVTQEEAKDIQSLISAMIDLLYVQHAKVTAALPPVKRTP